MNFPQNLRYTDHDEWILVDGDIITLGISDFAQDALGEIVHVELPEVDTEVGAGDAVCEVESVKAVAEVYTPIAGVIIAVNEDLDGQEDAVNSDPYGAGWLVKLKVTDTSALDGLADADAYEARVGA